MSFIPAGRGAASPFELVRRSLLQNASLPFSDALTAGQIQQAFDEEGVWFGEPSRVKRGAGLRAAAPSGPDDDDVVYTPVITLWAMISQALFTDVQRSCRAAVQRVAAYSAVLGHEVSSTNTGAYCRARAKVTEGVVRRMAEEVARRCEADVPEEWLWHGFRVRKVDGTTLSMPDTRENQAEYPQSPSQAEGLGFPIMRAVALASLATGMVLALASGPYAGKETGETALFRTLFDTLGPNDLVLADRYYGGWFMLALLQERGVRFVTRLHQHREANFHRGKRLGKRDHIAAWPKPQRPDWLDQETYDRLPAQLEVREVEVQVRAPGFRTESLVVVTSLHDHNLYTRSDIANLYRRRWGVELELRDIKTTMDLDVLRCKRPEAVRQELWTGILTYNLVRQSMLQAAMASGRPPDHLSFAASLQFLTNTWLLAAIPPDMPPCSAERLLTLRILNGHSHRVGDRPDRVEPRAVKRRPSPLALLKEPRTAAKARLLTSGAT